MEGLGNAPFLRDYIGADDRLSVEVGSYIEKAYLASFY